MVTSFSFPVWKSGYEINKRVERAVEGQASNFFMVHIGCCEVYEHVYFIVPRFSRFQFYGIYVVKIRGAKVKDPPSSGFSRYLSKIASSLTTCWVAVERMEAR